MPDFALHPRLQQDTLAVGKLQLCQLLMMNDAQYPWFILVPTRPDVSEIFQLSIIDRQTLLTESCLLAKTLQTIYNPDKLNIATIGNIVPQLHVHHIVRFQTDKSWPAPVWGKFPALAYQPSAAAIETARLRAAISTYLVD